MSNKQQYIEMAKQAATKHGLDPGVFVAQINQESGFNPTVSSRVGAQGIAQIMPSNSHAAGIDPFNPQQALDYAAKHMAGTIQTYIKQGYDPMTATGFALATYNGGSKSVDFFKHHGGIFFDPKAGPDTWAHQTGGYVKNIMEAAGHGFTNFHLGAHSPAKAAPHQQA